MTNLIIKIDNIVPEIHTVESVDSANTEPLKILKEAGLTCEGDIKVRELEPIGNIAFAVHVEITPELYPLPENFVMLKVFGDGTMFDLFSQLETILK